MKKITQVVILMMIILVTSSFVFAQQAGFNLSNVQTAIEKPIDQTVYDQTKFPEPTRGCPPGAVIETEGCGIDDFNGGCNMLPNAPVFEQVNLGDVFCGTTGNYIGPGGSDYRDTDWFEMVVTTQMTEDFILNAEADAPMYFFLLGPNDCVNVAVLQNITAGPGVPGSMNLGPLAPGTYWFWAGLQFFSGYPCDINYTLTFGPPSPPPSVPLTNWALYLGIFLIVMFTAIRFRKMV